MIRRKRKRTRLDELPIAKLHLDEVRDILQILVTPDSAGNNSEVHTKFIVRDQECDSVQELEEIGGTARRFEMIVTHGDRESRLTISPFYTHLDLSSPGPNFWVKHGEIRKIFNENTVGWKNFIEGLTNRPLYYCLPLVVTVVLSLVIPSWRVVAEQRTTPNWFALILVLLAAGWFTSPFLGSVVILRFSHTGGIRRWLRDHASDLLLLVFGALAGAVLTKAVDWLFHHFQH
jgi:hypothetical protein